MPVRDAEPSEIEALALLWQGAWKDAHETLAPPALTRMRTLENFRDRLARACADLRVLAGEDGAPLGFHWVKGDELHQLFVARPARGTGLAAALIADAEARLSAKGVKTAWLACMIGNARAARFYEKCGWRLAATVIDPVDTPAGAFPLEVWRFEKRLSG